MNGNGVYLEALILVKEYGFAATNELLNSFL